MKGSLPPKNKKGDDILARPKKTGLDYFPFDVDYWDDFKIADLLNRYGPLGTTIFEIVLSKVYKNGYYLEAPLDKLASQIVRIIGNRWIKDKKLVMQIIQYCADIGLLHNAFLSQSVITSVAIQRRYAEVTARNKVDKSKYWLLDEEKSQTALESVPCGGVFVTETPVFAAETEVNVGEIPQNKSKENEIKAKEKKSKVMLRLPATDGDFLLTEEEYCRLKDEHTRTDIDKSLEKLRLYLQANPHRQRAKSATGAYVEMWIKRDNDRLSEIERFNNSKRSYNLEEYEKSDIFGDL